MIYPPMMRSTCQILFFFLTVFYSYGQQKELQLTYACKGKTIGFNTVGFIDNRNGSQLLGIVSKGALNTPAEVIFNGNLADSLAAFFIDTSATALKSPLVLMVNELFLNELQDGMTETGRFRLSVRLFSGKQADRFTELLSVDSVYTLTGMDVTGKLLRSVSEQFCNIAKQASVYQLQSASSDSVTYSFQELLRLDSLEKLQLPMYQTDRPQAGIYKNYTQFKRNTPEPVSKLFIEERKNAIVVYVWDEKRNKKIKLPATGLFAVSDGTTLLRATALGFYKMIRENSDFYYWRPRPDYSRSGMPIMGGMFGIVGGLAVGALQAATANKNQWVLQKLNYRRGNSVPVSWVPTKPN